MSCTRSRPTNKFIRCDAVTDFKPSPDAWIDWFPNGVRIHRTCQSNQRGHSNVGRYSEWWTFSFLFIKTNQYWNFCKGVDTDLERPLRPCNTSGTLSWTSFFLRGITARIYRGSFPVDRLCSVCRELNAASWISGRRGADTHSLEEEDHQLSPLGTMPATYDAEICTSEPGTSGAGSKYLTPRLLISTIGYISCASQGVSGTSRYFCPSFFHWTALSFLFYPSFSDVLAAM